MAIEMTRHIYLDKLIKSRRNGLIKVITGISRCGKSYLLFNSFYDYLIKQGVGESHIIELPMKDRGYKRLKTAKVLLDYVKGKVEDEEIYYIFLDELQLVDDYNTVINNLLCMENVDIYIAGSDNVFLHTNILEKYDIDCEEVIVSPLCYRELVEVYNGDKQLAIDNFIMYGGMPMVSWMESAEEKKAYLYKVLSTKFMPEIVKKNSIKNVDEFVELIRMMATNMGCLTNPLKVANIFKDKYKGALTDKTIKNYLKYLQDEFFIDKVLRYDIKRRKYINTPSKYYFEDVGLANTFLDFEELREDKIVENIIYDELKMRGYDINVGVLELNIRDSEGKNKKIQLEVDFMVSKDDKRYYIQSALDESIREKHKTLLHIKDSFKKIIVVNDDIQIKRDEYGIVIMGLKEFLLKENSLEL